ncbi:MAG: hypothetical protein OXF79_14760 [Chloroflexi bacterium]|nr:hypothetical protein [Chloroflexota bacterium]
MLKKIMQKKSILVPFGVVVLMAIVTAAAVAANAENHRLASLDAKQPAEASTVTPP